MIQFTELPACQRYYRAPALANAVGYIPSFLSEDDPRPVREQFDENYVSGWSPFEGFDMHEDGSIAYPGDPTMPPLAEAWLRNEHIVVYPYAWVAIIQPDGSYEISRMD